MKEQQGAKTAGKPKALAVTLIILVMSLMANILLLTQNIGLNQAAKVEQGERILANFVGAKEELSYGQTAIERLQSANGEAGNVRLAVSYLNEAMGNSFSSLGLLLLEAKELEPDQLSSGIGALSAYMSDVKNLLEDISGGQGELTSEELVELDAVAASFSELSEAVSGFHFSLEGDRLSMIRLAGGHEWLPIASELQRQLLDYTGGMTLDFTSEPGDK